MKYSFSALIVCVFLFLAGFAGAEETVHIIQKGETIYSIARSYGVSPQDVLDLNKISDSRTVQAGQKIRIPSVNGASGGNSASSGNSTTGGNSASGAWTSAYDEYRVEKNDTLYSIARINNITLAELLDMNGFAPGYVLKAGEKIRVPAAQNGIAGGKAAAGGSGSSGTASSGGAAGGTTSTGSSPAGTISQGGEKPGGNPVPVRADSSVQWPVKAKAVSYLTGGLFGVQVTGEQKEPVKSLTRGTVVSTGPFRGFGNVAIVQKPDGYLYVYGGCETLSVKEGDKVVPGTELGKLGIDAKTAKPQLFFLVYRGNTAIDPVKAPRA